MQPEDLTIKRKRRILLFKFQLFTYGYALFFTPFILIPINMFLPRFPPFLNSFLLKPIPNNYTYFPESYGYFDPPAASATKAGNITQLTSGNITAEISAITDLSSSSPLLTPFLTEFFYWFINKSLKYIFFFHEVYFAFVCWAIFGSFDIFVNVIFSIIERTIDQTLILINIPAANGQDCINLYTGLHAHIKKIDSTLGGIIFAQEMLNLILNSLVVYAALVSDNFMLLIFFVFNSFTVTLRMYVFYLPISNVYLKSLKFVKYFQKRSQKVGNGVIITKTAVTEKITTSTSTSTSNSTTSMRRTASAVKHVNMHSLLKGKKLATLRHIVLRPLGLHRITPSSISDYILAVLSYMIVAIKT